jgi:hypothetical protein
MLFANVFPQSLKPGMQQAPRTAVIPTRICGSSMMDCCLAEHTVEKSQVCECLWFARKQLSLFFLK